MGLIVNPPKPGDASHAMYVAERDATLASLRERADRHVTSPTTAPLPHHQSPLSITSPTRAPSGGCRLANALDALSGVTCAPAEGALYLFPRIELPIKAIAAARTVGVAPDEFYALKVSDGEAMVR